MASSGSQPVRLLAPGNLASAASTPRRFQPHDLVWYFDANDVLHWPAVVESRDDSAEAYWVRTFAENKRIKVPFATIMKPYRCGAFDSLWEQLVEDAGEQLEKVQALRANVDRAETTTRHTAASGTQLTARSANIDRTETIPPPPARAMPPTASQAAALASRATPAPATNPVSHEAAALGEAAVVHERGAKRPRLEANGTKPTTGRGRGGRGRQGRPPSRPARPRARTQESSTDPKASTSNDSESADSSDEDDDHEVRQRSPGASPSRATSKDPTRAPRSNPVHESAPAAATGASTTTELASSPPNALVAMPAQHEFARPPSRTGPVLAGTVVPAVTAIVQPAISSSSAAVNTSAPTLPTLPSSAVATATTASTLSSDLTTAPPPLDPLPVFDVGLRRANDEELAMRVVRLNTAVRLRRDLVKLVRAHAKAAAEAGATGLDLLPAVVLDNVAYSLANFAAGLFALRPWEGPVDERARFDALAAAIDTEERMHGDRVLSIVRDVLPKLIASRPGEAGLLHVPVPL